MDPSINMDDTDLEEDPEAALRWVIANTNPDQWAKIRRALLLIQQHGGFAHIILEVRDGRISGHPKIQELSL